MSSPGGRRDLGPHRAVVVGPARRRRPPLLRGPAPDRGRGRPRPSPGDGALRPPPRPRQAPEGPRMNTTHDDRGPRTARPQQPAHGGRIPHRGRTSPPSARRPAGRIGGDASRSASGALAVPVALAAGAYVQQGPSTSTRSPPSGSSCTGSVDGSRYLLVESDRTDMRATGHRRGARRGAGEPARQRVEHLGLASTASTSSATAGRQRRVALPRGPGALQRRGSRGRGLVRVGLGRPPRRGHGAHHGRRRHHGPACLRGRRSRIRPLRDPRGPRGVHLGAADRRPGRAGSAEEQTVPRR